MATTSLVIPLLLKTLLKEFRISLRTKPGIGPFARSRVFYIRITRRSTSLVFRGLVVVGLGSARACPWGLGVFWVAWEAWEAWAA
jgi:hypothetical protein